MTKLHIFFFSSRRRHTRSKRDWSSDVCSSDLVGQEAVWGTVISTIPTISTTILGLLLGRLLMNPSPARDKIRIMGAIGLAGIALGWAMNPVIPVVQKLWTSSYGLASAGWSCLMFLAFYWI